eukprot:TRINITY_DN11544_c0_g1_i1.p1 TRINITY_DN11544_c0_g1~~TRINITY_DN11544_c0_g1_i1.p1  ORF type:complete len:137 (-),score=18.36 TRINITY_DN11544_c0_g1_i1:65-475(-)
MSGWQRYIDQILEKGLSEAAIYGLKSDGTDLTLYCISNDMRTSTDEIAFIHHCFESPTFLTAHGIKVERRHYIALLEPLHWRQHCFIAKTKNDICVCVAKSDKTVVIAKYEEGCVGKEGAVEAVLSVRDYLSVNGF